ncbi:hypothetical protein EX530_00150 [Xanthomonas phaseoli]
MAHALGMRHLQAALGGMRSLIQRRCDGSGNSWLGQLASSRLRRMVYTPALQWRQVLRTTAVDPPFRSHRGHCVRHTAMRTVQHCRMRGIAACTATGYPHRQAMSLRRLYALRRCRA